MAPPAFSIAAFAEAEAAMPTSEIFLVNLPSPMTFTTFFMRPGGSDKLRIFTFLPDVAREIATYS